MGFILMANYSREVIRSMKFLAAKKNSIFLGQSVSFPGNLLFKTLKNISLKKKLNFQSSKKYKWE